jgi:hypothetical protein
MSPSAFFGTIIYFEILFRTVTGGSYKGAGIAQSV